jgi:hypothetical protein
MIQRCGDCAGCLWFRVAAGLAERYATRCVQLFTQALPVKWTRRTAGNAIRIANLIAPGRPLQIAGQSIDPSAYFEYVIAAHTRDQSVIVAFIVDDTRPDASGGVGATCRDA